jgi:hypothetical protein
MSYPTSVTAVPTTASPTTSTPITTYSGSSNAPTSTTPGSTGTTPIANSMTSVATTVPTTITFVLYLIFSTVVHLIYQINKLIWINNCHHHIYIHNYPCRCSYSVSCKQFIKHRRNRRWCRRWSRCNCPPCPPLLLATPAQKTKPI